MDNKIRKYKFEFQIITTDTYLVDQNVTSYKFINKGDNTATLNNQMELKLKAGYFYDSYEEMIYTNEKTAQGYKIVFGTQNTIDKNELHVIKKIEVFE